MPKDFREVKVWQKAHRLTVAVYRATSGFAQPDSAGLTEEMRRSCASLSSNLVSANLGQIRGVRADREFHVYMRCALDSAAELESRLVLARDLELLPDGDYRELEGEVTEVKKGITSFLRTFGLERY